MANLELAAAFGAADAAKEQDLRGYYPMAARVLAEEVRRLKAERDALAREAHTWSKAAETYAKPRAPLTRQQIDDVMTQHYPLSSLLREEVDAFEACVRDLERLHGIGA